MLTLKPGRAILRLGGLAPATRTESSVSDFTLDQREQIIRIDRMQAELQKLLAETTKLQVEQVKLGTEATKLQTEQIKLGRESIKLEAEHGKLTRDRSLAPWQVAFAGMTAGAALFAAGIAFARFAMGG